MIETGVGALALAGFAALLAWWARSAHTGSLPRNALLGYRSRLTLHDAEAWRVVNRATSASVYVAAPGTAFGAVLSIVLAPTVGPDAAAAALGTAVVWALVWIIVGFFPASGLARICARGPTPAVTPQRSASRSCTARARSTPARFSLTSRRRAAGASAWAASHWRVASRSAREASGAGYSPVIR